MKKKLYKQRISKTANVETKISKPVKYLFLIPLLIGFLGFCLILLSSKNYGIGISGDSADYIMWADNLIAHHSFTKPDGSSLIILPPLYPTSIAFFKLFGIGNFLAVRLINAITFWIIIFLVGMWLLKYLNSIVFSILGSFLILISYPLMSVFCWAWSESVFIVFITAFLFFLPKAINNPNYKNIIILGIITAGACLTRYIGMVLLPVGGLVLFLGIKEWRKKFVFTILWGCISAIPFGIWILRNLKLSGTTMGVRFPSSTTLFENIQTAGAFIGRCFFIQEKDLIPGWVFFSVFSILILAMAAFYFYRFIKRKEINWITVSILSYIAFYFTLILYAATNTSLGSFEDRYLVPVYPAIVMLMATIAVNAVRLKKIPVRIFAIIVIVIFASLWLYTGFEYTAAVDERLAVNGFGFASTNWKNSATVAWLKENKLDGPIYTNDVHGLYIMANINAQMVPAKPDFYKNTSAKTVKELEKGIADFKNTVDSGQKVYLVWFASHFRKYLYDPKELEQFCNLTLLHRLPDGYIIALRPKPTDRE